MGKLLLAVGLVLASTHAAHADDAQPQPPSLQLQLAPPPLPTPFDRGKFGLGLGAASQTLFGENYFEVGGGVTYFVLDGVELGASGLHEFGSGPSISQLSPSLRYIAKPLVGRWPVIPYIGTFYKHWFVGGLPDEDTVGARAGFIYVSGHVLLGLGIAGEDVVSACTTGCTFVYPDVTVSLSL